jgi:hypothetical protein
MRPSSGQPERVSDITPTLARRQQTLRLPGARADDKGALDAARKPPRDLRGLVESALA